MLPEHSPKEFEDREFLWNSVESVEKSANARIARDINFALPKEMDLDNHIQMARNHIQECFVSKGMCADFSIHDKGDGNPHVHVLLTTRSLDE